MGKKSSRRLSEHERAERRRQDRERLQRAAEELLSSEGWQRWVRTRALFHSYSAGNCMLLALQCHEPGIVPQHVAGFRTWLKLGRCVRRNEKALKILAPVTVKERDERGEETGERLVFFKTAFVFELSHTEPLPGVEPVPLEPPREPLTGDSHAHLIEPLVAFAESLGFTVSFEQITGSEGGWCDTKARRIVVDGETIPYVSGWGEDGALEAVTEFAETIDRVARRIEDALLAASEDAAPESAARAA